MRAVQSVALQALPPHAGSDRVCVCVICPAVHATDLPTARQVSRGPPLEELNELRLLANEATLARGRGRLCTGQFVHQHDIDGRAARVGALVGKRPRLQDSFQ